ncbi:uncharacterized protein FFB20_10695 [Fusarium fujikuroi]|uniref:Uncharacterized protein n=1 Tax=Fusarium fujikuroi TaxID=5127 RepID=A0A9Q9RXE2_FUSFU|nr:uncharacterized protein FFB20_10695 [Fusarium fujikuroi]SCO20966.1 uncharacterized protein FFE2_14786 [Fusarium fujikuroi]SCO51197.1 uncharacterized protein FFNC_13675 [Fusarium fujikuroi]SCV59867.1 uncharacterized protein FFFS_14436 [Fusarium fujikuroi]VTT61751.1 unnamed protein product [Fusarium fujikuroi]
MPRDFQFVTVSNPAEPVPQHVRSLTHSHAVRQRHAKERRLRMQKHQEDMARNAESTSLNRALGYSRDPFAALPKQLLSHETFLLDHYVRVVVPYNVRTCRLFNQMNDHEGHVMRDWVGLAITDSDLLSSIILLGACRHILTNNPNSGLMQAALQYKYNGLKALRHAVSGASPTLSPVTIAKACAMALDEVSFGEAVVARQHIQGVFAMIEAAGGSQCLDGTGLLKRMYLRFLEMRESPGLQLPKGIAYSSHCW